MSRPLCVVHLGPRACCMTRQLGPHKVNCPASWEARSQMTCHEKACRHEQELTHPEPQMFCWFCGHQLGDVPLFIASYWEDGRTIGFCSKPHYDAYEELTRLWALATTT